VYISGKKWEIVGAPDAFRRSAINERLEQMFMGQYMHSLDSKGRLTIPSRYRALLVEGAYITQGFDRNLMVWTKPSFEKISQRVSQGSITDPTSRLLRRFIYSSGESMEVDRAGRILIPEFLRQVAQLDSEVVVVGVGDYFEIWSPPLWAEQLANLQDADANQQRFIAFDLSAG
jgi:MraZ protein